MTFKVVDTGGWTAIFQFGGPLVHSALALHLSYFLVLRHASPSRNRTSMICVFHFLAFSATGGSEEDGRDESLWSFDGPGARRWRVWWRRAWINLMTAFIAFFRDRIAIAVVAVVVSVFGLGSGGCFVHFVSRFS